MKDKILNFLHDFGDQALDEEKRMDTLFKCLVDLLTVVAFVMSVTNIVTKEYVLLASTAAFLGICVLIRLILRNKKLEWLVGLLFWSAVLVLFCFFFISGHPDGFSALWILLIPCFSMLIFGEKMGTVSSAFFLVFIMFFFWLPYGRDLLNYDYSETFMLRFPMLYIAVYLIALLMEMIRRYTSQRLAESEKNYRYLSYHDKLTGIFNRYGFNEALDKAFETPKNERIGVMMVDIDDFKNVNDTYGHAFGDVVLQSIADTMAKSLGEDAVLARWGGEEFIAFMTDGGDYRKAAEKLRKAVEDEMIVVDGTGIYVTISIGLCIANNMLDCKIATLINTADECMYKAKSIGKNAYITKELI